MSNVWMTVFKQTRQIWVVLAVFALLLPSSQAMPVMAVATAANEPKKQTAIVVTPVTTAADTAQPSITAAAPTVVSAAPAPQACVSPTYTPPAPLALSGQPTGLSQITDTTTYYRIYGNTAAQIETQLRQCPALTRANGTFGAVTGGTLSWQYNWIPTSTGTCTISNVKVGLHTNMILPAWQPTNTAVVGLAAQWNNLISNLAHHEDGHVTLYQQHAQQLLNNLQSMPAADCGSIAAQAEAKAAAIIASLDAANSSYDVHTNHGVSQGATLR